MIHLLLCVVFVHCAAVWCARCTVLRICGAVDSSFSVLLCVVFVTAAVWCARCSHRSAVPCWFIQTTFAKKKNAAHERHVLTILSLRLCTPHSAHSARPPRTAVSKYFKRVQEWRYGSYTQLPSVLFDVWRPRRLRCPAAGVRRDGARGGGVGAPT